MRSHVARPLRSFACFNERPLACRQRERQWSPKMDARKPFTVVSDMMRSAISPSHKETKGTPAHDEVSGDRPVKKQPKQRNGSATRSKGPQLFLSAFSSPAPCHKTIHTAVARPRQASIKSCATASPEELPGASRNHPKDLQLGRGTLNAERVSFVPLVPSVSPHAKSNDARLSALPRQLEGSATHVPLHAAGHPSSTVASPANRLKAMSSALIGCSRWSRHIPSRTSRLCSTCTRQEPSE